ncbi:MULTISPECIES: hypothetical protein [unclassified Nonomuraea]|uniref:hypothetical protein n=1 Tax=unclassified Nonomuraea TaxID=2593643 RepID=UPI0033EC129F
MAFVRTTAAGSTRPGQGWALNSAGDGIYLDVDTTDRGAPVFTKTPVYITSVDGIAAHFGLTGTSAIYEASNKGFQINVTFHGDGPRTLSEAQKQQWRVNWAGFETI